MRTHKEKIKHQLELEKKRKQEIDKQIKELDLKKDMLVDRKVEIQASIDELTNIIEKIGG